MLKKIPATLGLIIANCIVFALCYWQIGTFSEPVWTLGLLDRGAQFNPYTLDGQWYRIFGHMFLHGHVAHLLLCTYGLFTAGLKVESENGTVRFLIIYFLCGVAGALSNLYWALFTIGVGSSGAIFGLFGFALVNDVIQSRRDGRPILPQLINFFVFMAINLIFASFVRGDNASHLGGLVCGLVLGVCANANFPVFKIIRPEAAMGLLLLIIYFMLPRYQVTYFKFFQQVIHTEDSIQAVMGNTGVANEVFLGSYQKALSGWDTSLVMLDRHRYLPPALHSDTANLRRYIKLEMKEGVYRVKMIANESYIYLDSIQWAVEAGKDGVELDYRLVMRYRPPDTVQQKKSEPQVELTKIWYDSNWVEIPYPPSEYSRLGYRDSLGRWQGPLTDYYSTGRVQMKGTYKDDLKDGIFIYYSARGTYEAAGQYAEERRVGKWESFHPNGKMESEVYYRDRYFLKSYWDSLGVQMVKDGYGTELHRYPNGIVAQEGQYVDGYQEGYWYGRHSNGKMYFEENYHEGRLASGRSTSMGGDVVVYDESTLYALPKGGYRNLNTYIKRRTSAVSNTLNVSGEVRLTFRVTVNQQLADMRVEKGINKQADELAKKIIMEGPEWLPAKLHGQERVDGFAYVVVEF